MSDDADLLAEQWMLDRADGGDAGPAAQLPADEDDAEFRLRRFTFNKRAETESTIATDSFAPAGQSLPLLPSPRSFHLPLGSAPDRSATAAAHVHLHARVSSTASATKSARRAAKQARQNREKREALTPRNGASGSAGDALAVHHAAESAAAAAAESVANPAMAGAPMPSFAPSPTFGATQSLSELLAAAASPSSSADPSRHSSPRRGPGRQLRRKGRHQRGSSGEQEFDGGSASDGSGRGIATVRAELGLYVSPDAEQEQQMLEALSSAMHADLAREREERSRRESEIDVASSHYEYGATQPVASSPATERRRMPTLPAAQLKSLVRSHVRHVGLSSKLKARTHVRELREAQAEERKRQQLKAVKAVYLEPMASFNASKAAKDSAARKAGLDSKATAALIASAPSAAAKAGALSGAGNPQSRRNSRNGGGGGGAGAGGSASHSRSSSHASSALLSATASSSAAAQAIATELVASIPGTTAHVLAKHGLSNDAALMDAAAGGAATSRHGRTTSTGAPQQPVVPWPSWTQAENGAAAVNVAAAAASPLAVASAPFSPSVVAGNSGNGRRPSNTYGALVATRLQEEDGDEEEGADDERGQGYGGPTGPLLPPLRMMPTGAGNEAQPHSSPSSNAALRARMPIITSPESAARVAAAGKQRSARGLLQGSFAPVLHQPAFSMSSPAWRGGVRHN